MTQKEPEKAYPIRSLHKFLSELDKEWSGFKLGSLVTIIITCALLISSFFRLFGPARTGLVGDLIIFPIAIVFLIYVFWVMVAQYRFFRRWERRMRALVRLEEELISGKLDENASK
jgi:O-antigen/teichoic acid export membrane protein